jgi:multidrug resistance protein MdtO
MAVDRSSQRSPAHIALGLLSLIQAELAPFPSRMSGSLRDTLGITIALVFAMTWRVPGISLALALLFLLQRERPGLTLRSSLHILGGAALALCTSLLWVQLTDGSEVARFLGVVGGIFIAAFCMAGTSLPLLFTIFGFYWFVDLSAWDAHRLSGAIVTASLYNLASLSIVMFTAVGVEWIFGTKHPADELNLEMDRRLRTLSQFFEVMAEEESPVRTATLRLLRKSLVDFAHAGNQRMSELYNRVRDASADRLKVPTGTHYRIGLLNRVVEASALLGFEHHATFADRSYFLALAKLCRNPQRKSISLPSLATANTSSRLQDIHSELEQYFAGDGYSEEILDQPIKTPIRSTRLVGVFLPGAFRNRDVVLYALKLTLAATLCYMLYSAVAWPGILTCVVTVLFTGLSSTGAMKQKQLYRISGAAVGGVLGIATVSLLFPSMDSITSLVLVVGTVSFLSAWVLRSPNMGYVGVQIGFAFFLTTLPGFSAATLIAPARDRVIGIGIGILVSWLVFDQIWPVRTSTALGQTLQRIRQAAIELQRSTAEHNVAKASQTQSHLRIAVSMELANMQALNAAAFFDFGRDRKRELVRSRGLVRQIEAAAAEFYAEVMTIKNNSVGKL